MTAAQRSAADSGFAAQLCRRRAAGPQLAMRSRRSDTRRHTPASSAARRLAGARSRVSRADSCVTGARSCVSGVLVVLAASLPGPARALQSWDAPAAADDAESERLDRLPEPATGPAPRTEESRPAAPPLTAATVRRLEAELRQLRQALLELRSARSRVYDDLRRLGDLHGSLDDALAEPRDARIRLGARRQALEERERTLWQRLRAVEEEERQTMRAQENLERLLRVLPEHPGAPVRPISSRRNLPHDRSG